MSKYIIKNCPAYSEYWAEGCNNREKTAWLCQDCTDCVMKQVVEKCKNAGCKDMDCEYRSPKNCLQCGENIVGIFAQDVLDLFEIEECEGWK